MCIRDRSYSQYRQRNDSGANVGSTFAVAASSCRPAIASDLEEDEQTAPVGVLGPHVSNCTPAFNWQKLNTSTHRKSRMGSLKTAPVRALCY